MAKIDELEAQLAQSRKDIEILAALAGATAKEKAAAAVDTASAHVGQLSKEASEIYARAMEEGRRVSASAEEQIKSNPFAATGIAFALGMIVASFFNRR